MFDVTKSRRNFREVEWKKIFSKLDLPEAYLWVKVDEECSKLLTINTHKRLYKSNRLPFGIKLAPGIFQQVMDIMLTGSDFAVAYLDDILIKSESHGQHAEHVKNVFERIKDYGFKLSKEKCEFFMPRIKYLGQIIDENGYRPDPSRASAIQNMPPLKNITTLEAFWGLTN
ncbi:uncharacterized protein K02A2.6-like [Octopus bimaculoides]|uniref:uncharacterized protein K02A2.6-like n=1 Tax=Octopus bimaculoides TaxID=37653 RepID=UPI00071CE91D|nr:uncharacterized protein K02A2.6-like [Octopus bimaculoides]|eukprot:XP_014775807.1 PREDICTED: uncharacterized protein K02A2.6-like [Octopus bimaculoides]